MSVKRAKYIVPFLVRLFCWLWNSPNSLNWKQKHSKNIPVFENSATRIHRGCSLLFIGSWNWKYTNQSGLKYLLNTCSFTCYGHDGSQEFWLVEKGASYSSQSQGCNLQTVKLRVILIPVENCQCTNLILFLLSVSGTASEASWWICWADWGVERFSSCHQ